MFTANAQKHVLRDIHAYTKRRQVINLCYEASGPKLSYEEAAKRLNVTTDYVKKWVTYYRRTGLLGYVSQNQSVILSMYRKNPTITLPQARFLLKQMSIDLPNHIIHKLLHCLKNVLTNPSFVSVNEECMIENIKRLTEFQNKCMIQAAHKKKRLISETEHAYALPGIPIYIDHNYALLLESSDDEETMEHVTDRIFVDCGTSRNERTSKLVNQLSFSQIPNGIGNRTDSIKFKLALLREQVIYVCSNQRGPKITTAKAAEALHISETLITKWINEVKNIKNFVRRNHKTKCCGNVQETVVRVFKLNPSLTLLQAQCIMHHVNLKISLLMIKRHLNNLKYILENSDTNLEELCEEKSLSEKEIDYCNNILISQIASSICKKRSKANHRCKPLLKRTYAPLHSQTNLETNNSKCIIKKVNAFNYALKDQTNVLSCSNADYSSNIISDFKKRKRKTDNDDIVTIKQESYDEKNNVPTMDEEGKTIKLQLKKECIDQCLHENLLFDENVKIKEEINIVDEMNDIFYVESVSENESDQIISFKNDLIQQKLLNTSEEKTENKQIKYAIFGIKEQNSISEKISGTKLADKIDPNIVKNNERVIQMKPIIEKKRTTIKNKFEVKKVVNINSHKVYTNRIATTNILRNYKMKKYNADSDIDLRFEPIEEVMKTNSRISKNCGMKIKEKLDPDKQTVLTESIEYENDDYILIKYWPSKYFS